MNLLKSLATTVEVLGGRAYLVGGAVRDEILGLIPKDIDVEVFGIPEYYLAEALKTFAEKQGLKFSEVGKSFRVYKVGELDISLPRRDRKVGNGHRGFEVEADAFMSTIDAARRRDFTINALMKDLKTGEIVDHFGGLKDLETGYIRAVDAHAFEEDPLRVLRGIQFAARFDFHILPATLDLMRKPDLSELPSERLFTEFEKLLLKAYKPSLGLRYILTLPNLTKLFPMLSTLVSNPEDPIWHGEPNTFAHTLMVVDEAAKLLHGLSNAETLTVMLAALCHDLGKPDTTVVYEDGRCSAHGHAEAGLKPATELLDLLGVHTVDGFDVRGTVLSLVENHLFPPQIILTYDKDNSVNIARAVRRMAQKVRLDLLAKVSLADLLGRGTSEDVKAENRRTIERFEQHTVAANVSNKKTEPILMGRHLLERGMMPGVEMGKILKTVFDAQLDGMVKTLEDAFNLVGDLCQEN
jgi:tRNA nucleotidyltransferase (CCA-adding enzyme)